MRSMITFGIICFAIGAVCGGIELSYRIGFKNGVEHTEQCMDNWGKMKHDGWDFYCLY